jgi:hypothetical protein
MKLQTKPLAIITIVICAIMFAAGLKPKGFRLHNDVSWLKETNGLHFGKIGIAYTPSPFNAPSPESLTIEIAIKMPKQRRKHLAAIFDIWDAKGKRHVELCQWDSSLMVIKSRSRYFKDAHSKLCKSMSPLQQYFITITSSRNGGTDLYINGVNVRSTHSFDLCDSGVSLGRLVLGNSSSAQNPWQSDISAFSIYSRVFNGNEVLDRYLWWTKNHSIPQPEISTAAYSFDEHKGHIALDLSGRSCTINIPSVFFIPQKQVFIPLWEDFRLDMDLFIDYAVNIVGFIPFGYFFCALLWSIGGFVRRNCWLITLVAGSAISLFFEIAQIFIPTRISQLSDLILNITGTLLGIYAFSYYSKRKIKSK